MKEFFKKLVAVNNDVNEQAVMGIWFGLCATVSGFIPVIGTVSFAGFLTASLACFGIATTKK